MRCVVGVNLRCRRLAAAGGITGEDLALANIRAEASADLPVVGPLNAKGEPESDVLGGRHWGLRMQTPRQAEGELRDMNN